MTSRLTQRAASAAAKRQEPPQFWSPARRKAWALRCTYSQEVVAACANSVARQRPVVAQVSKPAVSPISKSARRATAYDRRGLRTPPHQTWETARLRVESVCSEMEG